jgi:hypothetical protein
MELLVEARDKAFNATTVTRVDGHGNRATCVQTKGGINPNLEEGESDYDDEGPSPCMVCADLNADRQAIAFAGGATCENAVGRRIVRTTMAPFRRGAPVVGERPSLGDTLCAVWHLEGGGYIHPAPLPDDQSTPDTIMYSWYDDHGGEFEPYRMPRRAVRKKFTRNPRRDEEFIRDIRVTLRCRRVYLGTMLLRDVTFVFTPSCLTIKWRSPNSGLAIETKIAPSHMTSLDSTVHGPAPGAGAGNTLPGAIREFFAISLRQKPPNMRFVSGFEPTDDEGPRKYVVVVLEGDALAEFKSEAVPAVVWGGHAGWPGAPVIATAAAARTFLEGVPIADAAVDRAALFDSLYEHPSARGNIVLKTQAVRAIMDDPLLREAAIAGALTRKMVRKALIARTGLGDTFEIQVMRVRDKEDIKAGIRTAAKILRTQARQARRLCDVCGVRGPLGQEGFPVCGGCGARRYCSVGCQREDWVAGGHSNVCDL